jgi:sulfur carrier protein ThiS
VTVTIHMHGTLRRFLPEGRDRTAMDLAPGTTVQALLASLRADRDTWLVAVNGATVDRDHALAEGDLVDCFEPQAAG